MKKVNIFIAFQSDNDCKSIDIVPKKILDLAKELAKETGLEIVDLGMSTTEEKSEIANLCNQVSKASSNLINLIKKRFRSLIYCKLQKVDN